MHDLNYCMPDLNYCMPDLNYCGITAELLRNYCGITAELLSNRLNYCMPEKIHRGRNRKLRLPNSPAFERKLSYRLSSRKAKICPELSSL